MIPVVAFAGWSGSGKTTLIEKLIAALTKRGLRVAALKHDGHRFELADAGKDSRRFADAGAVMTLLSSNEQTVLTELRPFSVWQALSTVHETDLILVEGWKDEPLPQIGVSRAANGKGFPAALSRYLAIVTDGEAETDKPKFGFDEIEELTDFLMKNMEDFTHFNAEGRAKMVDVGEKPQTCRTATAGARVCVSPETLRLIQTGGMKKGDVLTVAQIAGVMGAKRTAELIPMCHPVRADGIDLKLSLDEARCCVDIRATVSCFGRTGVEMEALTAASTAALTVYDMCKAVQKDMVITDVRLIRKTGGIHGDYLREDET